MDLRSSQPFWPIRDGLIRSYPALDSNLHCEVAVVGAGVTGALVADTLACDGHDVVVVDKRNVAMGSTSASTALLQYELDLSLLELAELRGLAIAERAYLACDRGISLIESRAGDLGGECGFERKKSLYLARRKSEIEAFQAECAARRKIGLDAEFWDSEEISGRFSFDAPAALHSVHAGQIDPYRFTHLLLERASRHGAQVFDQADLSEIYLSRDWVTLHCGRHQVRADRLILAAGYESVRYLPGTPVSLHSTFAVVSEPIADFSGWWDRCLLWESKRPYHYLRSTSDNRAIIGGEDDPFRNPARRDKLVERKSQSLARTFRGMFPKIRFDPAYAWAGTFGETNDGLAYIGPDPDHRRVLFACGFGGNGITFSALAAEIIGAIVNGDDHPDEDLFRLQR